MTVTAGPLRIGYLTNVYPAVSHSFIKREILALEAQGLTVQRWSIRPCAADLPDPGDRAEAKRTEVLLASKVGVMASALIVLASAPRRAWIALRAGLVGRPAGLRGLLVRLAYLAEACQLVRSARRHGVTHIHAHFGTNPATVARLAHLLGGPGYSVTVHGPDEFDQPLVHDLRGKVGDARFVAGISAYGRSQLMRWSALADWHRIHVVRCGLDAEFLAAAHNPIADDAPPVLVCVARLAPQKGLPVLLDAASRLHKAGHAFRIEVIGDGELRTQLERRIAEEGLADCVALRGAASMAEVQKAILGARAFVLPSFAEGLPVSIMEALALERPVITTRIAGIPELVDDACGRLIDAGDVDALCAAIVALLDLPGADLRAMGRIGRERVLAAHDAADKARQLLALFRAAGA